MTAAAERRPVRNVVCLLSETTDGVVAGGEHRHAGGDGAAGTGGEDSAVMEALVVEAGSAARGLGEPVGADGGEHLVLVDGLVGPFLVLLRDPTELAGWGIRQEMGDGVRPGGAHLQVG